MVMRVLIVGSSGMVGSEVLSECIRSKSVDKITLINRNNEVKDKKVKEIIHTDFSDFSKIKKQITGHDAYFYCVGVYTGQVPEDYFIKITYDYFKAFAKTVEDKKSVFCLFSAQGANSASNVMFAKWKGKCEEYLIGRKFKRIFIFRPGYIYPSNQTKKRRTLFYLVIELIFPLLNLFLPRYCITSRQLGRAMLKAVLNYSNSKTFENIDIRNS